jgi:hypothetical protein
MNVFLWGQWENLNGKENELPQVSVTVTNEAIQSVSNVLLN